MSEADDAYDDGGWIFPALSVGLVALAGLWVWLILAQALPPLIPIAGLAAGLCLRVLVYNTPEEKLPGFLRQESCLMSIGLFLFWPLLAWAGFLWLKKDPAEPSA